MKKNNKIRIIAYIISIIIGINLFIYIFNKTLTPSIIAAADAEVRARAIEIVNKCVVEEYINRFKYDEIIKMDKDREGNIVLLKADTLKMNMIACDVALKAGEELRKLGEKGIRLPLAYALKNNMFSYLGPKITVKMYPIGYIETKYLSQFESAGINQTRHKIYVRVNTKIRVILPLSSNIVEVNNEVPIAETIIIGKVPETALQFDDMGIKVPNNSN
ncbi:sporulation protein YunB [Clostridium ganghwense]|uniref:Sporulation protein YunB n=1 Tax=Clostridium ganghwense TaxID=312089 RepID=A0ABT4CQG1_9CLOT|nr:sporulation protein YunB [Clostridium ganghwense]